MTCDPATDLRAALAIVVLAGVALGLAIALLILVGDRRREALRRDRAGRLPPRLGGTHHPPHAESLRRTASEAPAQGATP